MWQLITPFSRCDIFLENSDWLRVEIELPSIPKYFSLSQLALMLAFTLLPSFPEKTFVSP